MKVIIIVGILEINSIFLVTTVGMKLVYIFMLIVILCSTRHGHSVLIETALHGLTRRKIN